MIGAVFLNDFYYMVQTGELFDSEGYMAKLEKLPGYYYKLMKGTDGVEAGDPFDYDNYYMEPSDGIEWDKDDIFEDDFRQAPVRSEKVGRNEPCPCESGKKYKKCCGKGA
ncbi:YecA family protein [Salipaludibacillus aurantiacus]|uniref:SEC-C motif-containing protein n=1 Tax=Salipaludibacillus aurantiacus TaxID=1601833 RepID=A0A1H9S3R6_9BACI|nr:SEC-C metal-binding domain-containing protein [Salipaludibacillus aurantiacus]SER79631.1 SEC-C motif-containing protein [Salipaludibacillus aurantiacus]